MYMQIKAFSLSDLSSDMYESEVLDRKKKRSLKNVTGDQIAE